MRSCTYLGDFKRNVKQHKALLFLTGGPRKSGEFLRGISKMYRDISKCEVSWTQKLRSLTSILPASDFHLSLNGRYENSQESAQMWRISTKKYAAKEHRTGKHLVLQSVGKRFFFFIRISVVLLINLC